MNYGSKQIRKKIKSLRSPYEKIGRKAVVLFFKLITVCIVVCFVMLTCVGLGAFTGIIETAPQISLDAVSPQWYQSYIYDSDGNKVETLVASGSNRIEASIDDMPKHLINAFIAIEDARFYSHNGIDPRHTRQLRTSSRAHREQAPSRSSLSRIIFSLLRVRTVL